ncbi:MAG: hypothetical protein MJ092_04820 [Lachnospiraceae bacterium]|nr:hypothetical protein [Lachnospiraceae bacterium]
MTEIIVITYPTALELWLDGASWENTENYSYQNRELQGLPELFAVPDFNEIAKEISLNMNVTPPVSFMVPSNQSRRNGRNYKKYVRPKHFPADSFIKMDTRLYPGLSRYEVLIASPEYCFLYAAKDYSFCQLVEIGINLCAMYVKDQDSSFGQRQREPILTSKMLTEYITNTNNMKHHKKALMAAKLVQDNSRSPIESKLATVSCLPKYQGGYGLKPPKLNYDIYHSNAGKMLLNRESSNCDLVWPKEKIVVEYDSNLAHGNAEQFAYDKMKYRSLTISDYKVFPIVSKDLLSLDRLDEVFIAVKKQLNGKSERAALKKYRMKREEVYKELFGTKNNVYVPLYN